jgi:hypothetical protein
VGFETNEVWSRIFCWPFGTQLKMTFPLFGLLVTVTICSPVRVDDGSMMHSVCPPEVPHTGPTDAIAGPCPVTSIDTTRTADATVPPIRARVATFR